MSIVSVKTSKSGHIRNSRLIEKTLNSTARRGPLSSLLMNLKRRLRRTGDCDASHSAAPVLDCARYPRKSAKCMFPANDVYRMGPMSSDKPHPTTRSALSSIIFSTTSRRGESSFFHDRITEYSHRTQQHVLRQGHARVRLPAPLH